MSNELVVQNTEIVAGTLFGTDDPAAVVVAAAAIAKTLEQVVRSQNLIVRIGQSEHVRVEGWTFLGSMLGVFPIVIWTRPVLKDEEPFGWEARVEARTRAGEIVGSAEAECLRSEDAWSFTPPPNKYGKVPPARDDYALRSMAQTRAVSKALRLPLGFVMQLAGFNPTPAEEMPTIDLSDPSLPFGDHAHEQLLPPAPSAEPSPTGPEGAPIPAGWKDEAEQKKYLKKLNVLIGKLRPDHVSTLQLWQSMGREPVPSEDGLLHWSPLRDSLTKQEAHDLIDRLDKYANDKLAA